MSRPLNMESPSAPETTLADRRGFLAASNLTVSGLSCIPLLAALPAQAAPTCALQIHGPPSRTRAFRIPMNVWGSRSRAEQAAVPL